MNGQREIKRQYFSADYEPVISAFGDVVAQAQNKPESLRTASEVKILGIYAKLEAKVGKICEDGFKAKLTENAKPIFLILIAVSLTVIFLRR